MYRQTIRDLFDLAEKFLLPYGISPITAVYPLIYYLIINHQIYHKRIKIEKWKYKIIPFFKITSKGWKRFPLTFTFIFIHISSYILVYYQLIVTLNLTDDPLGGVEYSSFEENYNVHALIMYWLPLQIYLPFFLYQELGIGRKNQYNRKIYLRDPLYVVMFVVYYLFVTGVYFYNQYWVIMENIYGVKGETYFLNWFGNFFGLD